jgi:LacI family transcriptional regulator
VDSIRVDNYGGAFAMVRHLAALGHRRIAHIAGEPKNYDARERLRGYRAAMEQFAGGAEASLIVEGDFTDAAGYRAAKRLLGVSPGPTAVFAANDSMAIGCLSALAEAGRRVPDDVALAGFDDIPTASFTIPPLTSVRVSIADLGGLALERLLNGVAMENRQPKRQETLPATLVVRKSCGAGGPANLQLVSKTASISEIGG